MNTDGVGHNTKRIEKEIDSERIVQKKKKKDRKLKAKLQ